jgi:hypothetical protein
MSFTAKRKEEREVTWTSKAMGLLAATTVLAALALSSGADSWYCFLISFGHGK